ncbi:DUF3015 family protein [Veronia pacifica]|uniref:DUF3015 domain-containing protein n=1 Tax=Veronia pacifica TaxID=1080227 RepID=A0A1C3EK67_9GAMM|nr:DUF3015 family protein [Veronia pacifica]ODA33631.1 hypothetical protein A8L45_09630 [Veronia pacifica]
MKKILAAAVMAATLPLSHVAMADSDIGCGLGTMIFDGKSGKAFKILGATTNGTSGNQTFGITFGTLGCDGTSTITSAEKLSLFIDGNMDNLARDMSRGEGETLANLSEVWGIEDQDKAAFNELAQANFKTIFSSENVNSQDVFANLNTLVSADEALSVYTI